MTLPSPVVIFFTTSVNASVWVGKMAGVVALWPLASWVIMLLSMPMRSHRPLQRTFSPSISISWYFRLEEPQLITRTFMEYPP